MSSFVVWQVSVIDDSLNERVVATFREQNIAERFAHQLSAAYQRPITRISPVEVVDTTPAVTVTWTVTVPAGSRDPWKFQHAQRHVIIGEPDRGNSEWSWYDGISAARVRTERTADGTVIRVAGNDRLEVEELAWETIVAVYGEPDGEQHPQVWVYRLLRAVKDGTLTVTRVHGKDVVDGAVPPGTPDGWLRIVSEKNLLVPPFTGNGTWRIPGTVL